MQASAMRCPYGIGHRSRCLVSERHRAELHPGYQYTHGGMDCWNCTGYLYEVENRFNFSRDRYPEKHREIMNKLREIQVAARTDLNILDELLHARKHVMAMPAINRMQFRCSSCNAGKRWPMP